MFNVGTAENGCLGPLARVASLAGFGATNATNDFLHAAALSLQSGAKANETTLSRFATGPGPSVGRYDRKP